MARRSLDFAPSTTHHAPSSLFTPTTMTAPTNSTYQTPSFLFTPTTTTHPGPRLSGYDTPHPLALRLSRRRHTSTTLEPPVPDRPPSPGRTAIEPPNKMQTKRAKSFTLTNKPVKRRLAACLPFRNSRWVARKREQLDTHHVNIDRWRRDAQVDTAHASAEERQDFESLTRKVLVMSMYRQGLVHRVAMKELLREEQRRDAEW